jgi:UDP-N-acetyl-D-glucosamine dehydrogenase
MTLLEKIESRTATIAVMGVGYVGLPLSVAFAEAGFRILAFDLNPTIVSDLNSGHSYIDDVPDDVIAGLVNRGRLKATLNEADLEPADVFIISVPTPLSRVRDPDLTMISSATDTIARHIRPGSLVVLESTTFPGTTEEIVAPVLESATNGPFTIGKDVYLAFSPERTDPGRTDFNFQTTPKVVGGITPACLDHAIALYSSTVDQVVPVSTTAAAEMVKLLENTFRATNIALANEFAIMCDQLNLDVWEIIEGAKSKPFGFMPFYPGLGVGGHCIPIDPHYLAWKLKTINYTVRFVQLASEVNASMPVFVMGKISGALNDDEKAVRGSRVLVLGVAYKPDVPDLRESPALELLKLLQAEGASVDYHDPWISSLRTEDLTLDSVPLTDESIRSYDCVAVATGHSDIDWLMVGRSSRVIVDSQNVMRSVTPISSRVVTL